jgi:hypothetical protein
MLYIYNVNPQTLADEIDLQFVTTGVQTGCTAVRNANNGVTISRPGFYMVHFNADAATSAAAGNISVQLAVNGIDVPGAEATETSSAVTDIVNLGFTAIIAVPPNQCCNTANVPAILTVRNVGIEAAYSNAALTVTKIA